MRHIIILVVGLALMGMAGCAKRIYSTPPAKKRTSSSASSTRTYAPKTRPYTVLGETYYPLQTAAGYDEVGLASWYGEDFHGKKTANGQIYDMYGISAAHKTLPLGTRVRVTNLENNRNVILVINDRGPFVGDRIIDLSYGAAQKLDTVERGVAKVRISAIGSIHTNGTATATVQYFHVRVGAFADRANAERTLQNLKAQGYKDASITTVDRNGQTLHIVQAGSFISRDKAEQIQEQLKPAFPSCYIVS